MLERELKIERTTNSLRFSFDSLLALSFLVEIGNKNFIDAPVGRFFVRYIIITWEEMLSLLSISKLMPTLTRKQAF